MATETNEKSRQDRFETWNPYAGEIKRRVEQDDELPSNDQLIGLAIAFEVAQLRAEVHFAAKRGQR